MRQIDWAGGRPHGLPGRTADGPLGGCPGGRSELGRRRAAHPPRGESKLAWSVATNGRFYFGAAAAGVGHALVYGHVLASAKRAAGGRTGTSRTVSAGPGGTSQGAARRGSSVLSIR